MKNSELSEIYSSLDANPVIKTNKEQVMGYSTTHIITDYKFSDYRIEHIQRQPQSVIFSIGQFNFYKKGELVCNWNENFGPRNRWVYDLYIASKNKVVGEPYYNPFLKSDDLRTMQYKFNQTLDKSLAQILPSALANYKQAIQKQLQQKFEQLVKQYQ